MNPKTIKQDMFEINLDVNFVNNRRMRIGDYGTAIASFEEVISRHEAQPFAHYFLAEAIEKIGGARELVINHRKRYQEIIFNDPEWAAMAEHFNLMTHYQNLPLGEKLHNLNESRPCQS
jgi:hypothetical protein